MQRFLARYGILLSVILFLVFAPLSVDTYNTLNQRAFLDLVRRGNPFAFASHTFIEFHGQQWVLDWPYPPLAILLDLPAWLAYQLTRSELVYQYLFKLPFMVSAVVTQKVLTSVSSGVWRPSGLQGVYWYVLNPAVILLTTVAGGFDVIAAFLILLGYVSFSRGRHSASALLIGLAGALRLYPLVVAPVYLLGLHRQKYS